MAWKRPSPPWNRQQLDDHIRVLPKLMLTEDSNNTESVAATMLTSMR